MKNLITILFLIAFTTFGQLPYSWTTGVNPGWVSSNPSNNTLGWQSYGNVSTSNMNGAGWYTYNNSQITTYTSPVYNFTGCNVASVVSVTINLGVNLENTYDWLYFQYTINGTTWINPVGMSAANNNSGVNLSAFPPLTNWANGNSNRNGWTGAVLGNQTFLIPITATRFRFIFVSDGIVNTYGPPGNPNIYYADINDFTVQCLGILPVELVSFTGTKGNNLTWVIDSETDCDYYTLERSTTGTEWTTITTVQADGAYSYSAKDDDFENVINYYRLSQTDLDGTKVTYDDDIVSIDNRRKDLKVVSVTNLLGQAVYEFATGLVIVTYEDGTSIKEFR